jgi:hypothetical protein
MRLAGRCCDVLEIGVIVQDHGAVMFRHGGSKEVNHSGSPVMTADCHPDLNIAGTVRDRLADRQDNIEILTASGDFPDIGQIATGVAGFQIDSHAGRGGAIGDKPSDHGADRSVLASGLC